MLELVVANRFDRRLTSGKTKPCIVSGLRASDEEVELVVKFSAGCERNVTALACEALSAMFGADLDLPVPEPFLVKFDTDFITRIADTEVAAIARRSASLAFGSKKLPPGFMPFPVGMPLRRDLLEVATEIFAFDCMIQNVDRRPANPNCLRRGKEFAIFDHELAFAGQNLIGWKPPWVAGGLEPFRPPDGHLFAGALKGKATSLDRLVGAMESISDDRLEEYRKALPADWASAGHVIEEALEYLRKLRDNMGAFVTEVYKVLA